MSYLTLPDFADKLNEIMPILIRHFARMQPSELFKGKVTLPQVLILQHLSSEDAFRMTDIAKFMKVSTAAATGLIDRLVKSGYVVRVFEEDDRRIIKIQITPKGLALMKKLAYQRRNMVIEVFRNISEQDREDYLRILSRVKDSLSSE